MLFSDTVVCRQSLDAIQGAIGTICEAVDAVFEATLPSTPDGPECMPSKRTSQAFVAIRPPGHHCGEDTPCGFCFTNNVAIGAAHGRTIVIG